MASISKYLVSQNGLSLWVNADESPVLSGTNILSLTDLSGNGRTMTASSPYPQIVTADTAANSMPAIAFNGSDTTPFLNTSSANLKAIFVVASYPSATYPGGRYMGLVGGPSSGSDPVGLVSGLGGAIFHDAGYSAGVQTYRRANVTYGNSAMIGPVSGVPRVMELTFPSGLGLSNGTQLGKDRGFSDRVWLGNVHELLCYTRELTEPERSRIYEYFARKYHTWEQASAGAYDVLPTAAGWGSSDKYKKATLIDVKEDGTRYSRTKSLSYRSYNLKCEDRTPDEIKAVQVFYDTKFPGSKFVYRDRFGTTAVDRVVMFHRDAEIGAVMTRSHTRGSYDVLLQDAEYTAPSSYTWATSGAYDLMPATAGWGSPDTYKTKVLIDDSEDLTRYSRTKVAGKKFYEVKCDGRRLLEVEKMRSFYNQKFPDTTFAYTDRTVYPAIVRTVKFQEDAAIEVVYNNHLNMSYSVLLEDE